MIKIKVVLYSTGCPKCNVLKRKLDDAGIEYTVNNSVDDMLNIGLTYAPALDVDGNVYDFTEAVSWISSKK